MILEYIAVECECVYENVQQQTLRYVTQFPMHNNAKYRLVFLIPRWYSKSIFFIVLSILYRLELIVDC